MTDAGLMTFCAIMFRAFAEWSVCRGKCLESAPLLEIFDRLACRLFGRVGVGRHCHFHTLGTTINPSAYLKLIFGVPTASKDREDITATWRFPGSRRSW